MADIRFNDLIEKTTPVAIDDETLIIDSEDGSKVKRIKATQYKGPKGDTGTTGADGLSINWKGTYDNNTSYVVNDAVSYNDSSYISIQDTTGNLPTNTTYWNLIAKKGADGTGSGDMSKSTYDTNDNGVVDDSEKLGGKLPSDYELVANKLTAFQSTPDDTHYASEKLVKDNLDLKENAFIKNTGFNLNLGTTAGTVSEGNHTHSEFNNIGNVGTKAVDETNLADGNAIQYDSASDKYVSVPFPTGGASGGIETIKIAGEQIAGTYYFEYDADSNKTVGNVEIALQVANTGADFIVKCYKNGTDLAKNITIADGGGTAVNGRYKASLNINETLAADDVFELEINQVGSDVAGSEFSSLINIS